ncbi:MAG: hypothetical protein KAT85_04395, partial [candidate division Zixibacteria bacterium]|nr:hypothetical protein [candidate division Zixibacteria bacterium]
MLDDDFAKQLADIPDVEQAIDELFNSALAKNEQRFYLCVLDLSRIEDPERPLLLFDHRRRFVIQQFWDFLLNTLVSPTEFAAPDQQSF